MQSTHTEAKYNFLSTKPIFGAKIEIGSLTSSFREIRIIGLQIEYCPSFFKAILD